MCLIPNHKSSKIKDGGIIFKINLKFEVNN